MDSEGLRRDSGGLRGWDVGWDVGLLLETFGGFGPELRAWLQRLTEERQNKLTKREYDDTTWAARTWRSYAAQQLSVALHRSCALEIANALGLSGAADERQPA